MPLDSGPTKDLLDDVCSQWNDAEGAIKRAEQLAGEAVIPSINELRYAGRRLIEAVCLINSGGDPDRISSLLGDARFDCLRARHDAIDTAVLTINLQIREIQKRVPPNAIMSVYTNYSALLKALKEVQEQVAEARANRDRRDDLYKSLARIEFSALEQAHKEFMASEDVMIQMAKLPGALSQGLGLLRQLAL